MKKQFLGLALLVVTSTSFAAPSPIRENVQLKNEKFAGLIFDALAEKIKPTTTTRTGASQNIITIKGLVTCTRDLVLVSGGKIKKKHNCSLLKGGWNELGTDVYGSGDKEKATKELYAALSVKEEKDEAFTAKSISLDVESQHGGTERNLLNCMMPTKVGSQLGLRATCQLINGM